MRAVIARSEATKQSIYPLCCAMDCFATLAMTQVAGLIEDARVKSAHDELNARRT
ncbi:hypothetical protein ACVILL_001805 [Bradyrhizobium sp. USDA 3364]